MVSFTLNYLPLPAEPLLIAAGQAYVTRKMRVSRSLFLSLRF